MSADCIFCRIVRGEAFCARVHEDELTLAFMDLSPVSRGHLLIVPKRHFSDLLDADEESLVRVMANSRRIAHALKRALGPDGIGVHQLNGAAAGQSVFHYHMHLIPRHQGDPIAFHGRRRVSDAELAAVAALVAGALTG